MDLYPFTFEEVVRMSIRWMHLLPAHYRIDAPQHLLSTFLYHQEGHRCHGCSYNYGGHSELIEKANQIWQRG